MKVTRLDLDGAGSPQGLVQKILATELDLPIPVPIEDLAYRLDISEISELGTDGFEGGLLTDEVRSFGGILVRRGMDRRRRRFTIGHELGHFLMPFHKPVVSGQFLCSRADMRRWTANEQSRAAQMEVDANKFSALILMPPPYLRAFLAQSGDPDLQEVLSVHEKFDVSKEAAARAYAQYHDESIAIIIVRDGYILRSYRNPSFSRLKASNGEQIPRGSSYYAVSSLPGTVSQLQSINSGLWLETEWGKPGPETCEQVLFQGKGFAMILLWAAFEEDEEDRDEDRTSKQRYQDRMSRRL
jgi:hypothetical protein